jgi:capsular exopolysaccharide synthesis family protein
VELADYLVILRARWRSVLLVTLLGIAAAGLVIWRTPVLYTTSTQTMVAVIAGDSTSDLNAGTTLAKSQVSSYAAIAAGPKVLLPVMAELGTDESYDAFAGRISVTVPDGTTIIEVAATAGTPEEAKQIADAVSAELVKAIGEFSPVAADGYSPIKATVVTPALLPTQPTQPRPARTLALGLVAGLLVGCVQAVLRTLLDRRVRDEEDVADVTEAPVVGAIQYDKPVKGAPDGPITTISGGRAEDYRRLRTNLQFFNAEPMQRVVVVTSSIPNEGKTTTAVNLALTLAQAGEEVLLVDADMRQPSVGKALGLSDLAGLSSLLSGTGKFEDYAVTAHLPNLTVLPAGIVPPNPSELLGSTRFDQLLSGAVERYRHVVVDTPPVLPVTDGAIVARAAGGVFLVVGANKTTRQQLGEALDALQTASATVRGIVLNKATRRSHDGDYGYYYYESMPGAGVEAAPAKTPRRSKSAKTARTAKSPDTAGPVSAATPTLRRSW